MHELHERDAMICHACRKEERASEGYPCTGCDRFICNICMMRGVSVCVDCAARARATVAASA